MSLPYGSVTIFSDFLRFLASKKWRLLAQVSRTSDLTAWSAARTASPPTLAANSTVDRRQVEQDLHCFTSRCRQAAICFQATRPKQVDNVLLQGSRLAVTATTLAKEKVVTAKIFMSWYTVRSCDIMRDRRGSARRARNAYLPRVGLMSNSEQFRGVATYRKSRKRTTRQKKKERKKGARRSYM